MIRKAFGTITGPFAGISEAYTGIAKALTAAANRVSSMMRGAFANARARVRSRV